MYGKRNLLLKMVAFLSLTVMLPSSAEYDQSHLFDAGGRSFSGGVGGSNNLNNVLSSCGAGRLGTGVGIGGGAGITGAGVAGAGGALGQGGANFGDGLIQASIPPGTVPSSVTASTLPGATVIMAKCMTCHNGGATSPPKITSGKGIARIDANTMPPRDSGVTLSAQEKQDLKAFLSATPL